MPPLNVPRPRAGPSSAAAPSPALSQPSSSSSATPHPFVHTAIRPKPKRVTPPTASSSSTNTPASSVAFLPKAPKARRAKLSRGRRKRPSSDDDDDDTGTHPSPSDDEDDDHRRKLDTDEEDERREQVGQAEQSKAAVTTKGGPSSSNQAHSAPPPTKLNKTASVASTVTLSATPSSSSPALDSSTGPVKAKKKRVKKPKATIASLSGSSPPQPTASSSSKPTESSDPSPSQPPSSSTAAAVPSASASGKASTSESPSVPRPLVDGPKKLDWSDDVSPDSPLPEIDFADLGKAELGLVGSPVPDSNARHLKAPNSSRVAASSPNPSTASSASARAAVNRAASAPFPTGSRQVNGNNSRPHANAIHPSFSQYHDPVRYPFGPGAVRPGRGGFGSAGYPGRPPMSSPAVQAAMPAVGSPSSSARVSPSVALAAGRAGSVEPVVEKSKRALKREKVERKIQRMKEERERRFGSVPAVRPAQPSTFTVPPAVEKHVVVSSFASPPAGIVRVKLPGTTGPVGEIKKLSPRALKVKAKKERERAEREAAQQIVAPAPAPAAAEEIVVRLPKSKMASVAEVAVAVPTGPDSTVGDPSELGSSIHSAVTPPQQEPTHPIIEHPQPRRHPSETNVLYKSPAMGQSASLPVQQAMVSPPVIINLGPTTAIGLASDAPPPSDPASTADAALQMGDEPVTNGGGGSPRFELSPGRPHPRDEYSHRPTFPGQPFQSAYPGQGAYPVEDSHERRLSDGPDPASSGMVGPAGGMPALPPGFYATENGQVFDAMGQQYVFTYPPPPPQSQPFLPPHLRQHSPAPAFWNHSQPSPQFADGHYHPGQPYSPTSPAYPSYDHQLGSYGSQAPYQHQPSYPSSQPYAPYPPQQYHQNGPIAHQPQHQHVPSGPYSSQPSSFFVPRRQGFAPVRISDPHGSAIKAGGGMVASSHLPMHPKASMSFQPVSYASYQHHDDRSGPPAMGGRSASFDSDRTNEPYNGGPPDSYTYQ